MNQELYKTTIESFGIAKPSKVLTTEARKIANGKPGDMKIIKAEIARCKLLEKKAVTAKQQERINKLTEKVDNMINKSKQPAKLPSGRQAPVDPRKQKQLKPKLTRSEDDVEHEC